MNRRAAPGSAPAKWHGTSRPLLYALGLAVTLWLASCKISTESKVFICIVADSLPPSAADSTIYCDPP